MTDDERAARLLELLREEPTGPSTVDVPRAMAEGRRRRVLRRWSGGVGMVAVTAIAAGGGTVAVQAMDTDPRPRPTATATPVSTTAAALPAGPTSCAITKLPTGGITKALVTAGDPSGHYIAGRVYPTGKGVRTVLWKDGQLQKADAVPGSDADINDINSAGVGVGSGFDDGGHEHAYVLRNGAVTKLAGGPADAVAINAAGVIVGALGQLYEGVPARWPSAGAAPVKLPMPTGATIGATAGIDEDGTVIGTVGSLFKENTGYLWSPDGSFRPMPLPTVAGQKADFFWPESISNGWVFGRAVFDNTKKTERTFASMRYHIATNTYEKLAVTFGPPAIGAANGWILGVGNKGPLIVAGTRTLALPMYRNVTDYIVQGFSADGRVATGYSTGLDNSGTDNLPFLWTCH